MQRKTRLSGWRAARWPLIALLSAAAPALMAPDAGACGGVPPVVCGKSTILAKPSPRTMVVRPGQSLVTLPVTFIVRASGGNCPIPTSTTIRLTATCNRPTNGTGLRTVVHSTTGVFRNVGVTITFAASNVARQCLVTGTATTTWSDGSTTTGRGDTVVCFVDPAPDDPSKPRLDLELLTPGLLEAHAGDQVTHRYRVTNNDPDEAVTVVITGDSEQVGRLSTATGDTPGSGIGPYAVAAPVRGDDFPIVFEDDLAAGLKPDYSYLHDDGTREAGIGRAQDGGLLWLNEFEVEPGAGLIDKITLMSAQGVEGKPLSVLLYGDPNDDGDPSDAVLLAKAKGLGPASSDDSYTEYPIKPTYVGAAGERFFVGVVMQETGLGEYPAGIDTGSDAGRSWIAAADPGCAVDIENLTNNDIPITNIRDIELGVEGNWTLQAHGNLIRPWVALPPDPHNSILPTIERTIRLCPKESYEFGVASRSWGGCSSGSCSEDRVDAVGAYDDDTEAIACAGAVHLVNNTIAPAFDCGDGGARACLEPGENMQFVAHMPQYDVRQMIALNWMQVQLPSEHQQLPAQTQVLGLDFDGKPRWGRTSVDHEAGGEPVIFVDEFFDVAFQLDISSLLPETQTELREMHLIGAPPELPPDYFTLMGFAGVSGPSIPPELDAFLEALLQAQVVGVGIDQKGQDAHLTAMILPDSIDVLIQDDRTLDVRFQAVFQPNPDLPEVNWFHRVSVNIDATLAAAGILVEPEGPPCPGDVNGDGFVDFDDLLAVLSAWGNEGGPEDLDGSGEVDFGDVLVVLSHWGPCPR